MPNYKGIEYIVRRVSPTIGDGYEMFEVIEGYPEIYLTWIQDLRDVDSILQGYIDRHWIYPEPEDIRRDPESLRGLRIARLARRLENE